jgi:hypothetical protein
MALDAPRNPFDPASLRLSSDFSTTAVERVLTTVPVTRPNKQQFVRVHSGPEYRIDTAVLKWADDGQTYLAQPEMRSVLANEIEPMTLFTAIDRQGQIFLWPVRLPGADGRTNSWFESCRAAAELATKYWVRIRADMPTKAYITDRALGELSDPIWPNHSFSELLRLAFQDRNIGREDHPVVLKLKGQA